MKVVCCEGCKNNCMLLLANAHSYRQEVQQEITERLQKLFITVCFWKVPSRIEFAVWEMYALNYQLSAYMKDPR